MAKFCRR